MIPPPPGPRRAVFLDRDGTLVVDRHYLADPEGLEFIPGASDLVRAARAGGALAILATNQSGVGRGMLDLAGLARIHDRLRTMCEESGAPLDGIEFCPHPPDPEAPDRLSCDCRKPAPGMLLRAALRFGISLPHSLMVGDRTHDVDAGRNAGCRTVRFTGTAPPEDPRSHAADAHAGTLEGAAAEIRALLKIPSPPAPEEVVVIADPDRCPGFGTDIHGRSFGSILIGQLAAQGIGRVLLSGGSPPDPAPDGIEIVPIEPDSSALPDDSGPRVVLRGDVLPAAALGDLLDAHRRNDAAATLLAVPPRRNEIPGRLVLDESNRVQSASARAGGWIDAGAAAVDADAFSELPPTTLLGDGSGPQLDWMRAGQLAALSRETWCWHVRTEASAERLRKLLALQEE